MERKTLINSTRTSGERVKYDHEEFLLLINRSVRQLLVKCQKLLEHLQYQQNTNNIKDKKTLFNRKSSCI